MRSNPTISKVAKLVFDDKQTFHKNGSNTVTVKVIAHIVFLNNSVLNWLPECDPFETVGVATCSPEDQFDLNKGYKIASSRSENEAYNVAANRVRKIIADLNFTTDGLIQMEDDLAENRRHNHKFEYDVISDKFVSKRDAKK